MNPLKNITGMAEGLARQGFGLVQKARHLRPSPKPDMSDETLKAKVESVVFRSPDVGRSDVNVTVVDRRVTLHGQAKRPEAVKAMEAAVRAIPEVLDVDNRLALKGSTSRKKPAVRRTPRTTRNVSREVKSTSKGEPSPKELASSRKGRQPAPMGARGTPATGAGGETPGAKVEAALETSGSRRPS